MRFSEVVFAVALPLGLAAIGLSGLAALPGEPLPALVFRGAGSLFFVGLAVWMTPFSRSIVAEWWAARKLPVREPVPLEPLRPPEGPRPPWISPEAWSGACDAWRYSEATRSEGTIREADSAGVERVTAETRAASAPSPPSADSDPCPTGSLDELQTLLDGSPSLLSAWNPVAWPVCCDRLAVLALVNPSAAELAQWPPSDLTPTEAGIEPEQITEILEARTEDNDLSCSVHLFRCSACGRAYASPSHT